MERDSDLDPNGLLSANNAAGSDSAQEWVRQLGRRCGPCHQELGDGHICRLEDLPKRLQAVVLAVADAQRGGE
jgi:hypothetical protein